MPHDDPMPQSLVNKFKEIIFVNCVMVIGTRNVNKKVVVLTKNKRIRYNNM